MGKDGINAYSAEDAEDEEEVEEAVDDDTAEGHEPADEEAAEDEDEDEEERQSTAPIVGRNVERLIRAMRINARRFILEACQEGTLKLHIGSIFTVCGRFPHPTPKETKGESVPFNPKDIDVEMLNEKCRRMEIGLRFMDTAFGFMLALEGERGIRTVVTNGKGFTDIIFTEGGTVRDLTRTYGTLMRWLIDNAQTNPVKTHKRGRRRKAYNDFDPDKIQDDSRPMSTSERVLGDVEELFTPGSNDADNPETIVRKGIEVHE